MTCRVPPASNPTSLSAFNSSAGTSLSMLSLLVPGCPSVLRTFLSLPSGAHALLLLPFSVFSLRCKGTHKLHIRTCGMSAETAALHEAMSQLQLSAGQPAFSSEEEHRSSSQIGHSS